MFTGIIETTSEVQSFDRRGEVLRLSLARPQFFDDVKVGDSISVNGVCLTVVVLSPNTLEFDVGRETQNITNWQFLKGDSLNVERSLKLSDRVHGHLVSGHVDEMGLVTAVTENEQSKGIRVRFSPLFAKHVWKKGSVTLNGVSLTVNEVTDSELSVWLIPETIQRTNLKSVKIGDKLTLEADMMSRFWLRQKELNVE